MMPLRAWLEIRLDELLTDGDWGVRVESGKGCMWSAEVRVTQHPGQQGPDRSIVFYSSGGESPDDVLEDVLEAAVAEVKGWS